ncbi:MAG: hypothetical protein OXI40_16830 [Chloroflexota bacterium]|nr:hypothetical protein [Chloroflexota bacterium]
MDISSGGGALIISVLRLLHIVAGMIWVGAAIMMSFYVEPASERSGGAGARFLRDLYGKSNYARMIPVAAIITTLAGLLLYGMMSYHETMNSAMGMSITLGALFGLLAFGHGFFALWRSAGQYSDLAKSGDGDEAALQALEDKLRRNGRIGMWLALVSLVLMAGARYISPLFG